MKPRFFGAMLLRRYAILCGAVGNAPSAMSDGWQVNGVGVERFCVVAPPAVDPISTDSRTPFHPTYSTYLLTSFVDTTPFPTPTTADT